MMSEGLQAVVFDMGGVIVDLGPISDLLGGEPATDDLLWERWLTSTAVRDFEMGRCSVEEFGANLVTDLGLSSTGEQVLERFRRWPRGLYPGAADLVRSLEGTVEIGLLSNTNALHWFTQTDHEEVRALFDRTYLSFELGMAKPDTDVFNHLVADLGAAPEAILFLDDNQMNVDAARTVGIRAELAEGVAGARTALAGYGLPQS
jgi:HAD superfamily hydrolase (TIGR01509 family)